MQRLGRQAPRRPRRRAVAAPAGGWLDLAWLLLWLLGLAAILVVAPWEAIAFHLIWVSFGLMIWHARRRQAADAASARVSAENSRLLTAQVRFLQDASHQLRTPITIALGHAELLARTVADRAGQRDIDVVVGELNRLRRLSERLLVIAASENSDFLRPEPVAVDQLTAELLGCWRSAAARSWQLGPLGRATVAADRERLRLALDALLENAVQHTDPGDLIRLSAVRCPHSQTVSLVVEDSGPGIPPAEIEHIFERFRTGSAPGRHAGTGLGLALVQAVARGHGGEVRVDSTPGHGSRFELRLPEHPASTPADRAGDPASPAKRAADPGGSRADWADDPGGSRADWADDPGGRGRAG
ncbi:MAG TPA: HAMP domain-containing sensor histidine kinase [Streptosporangiaceae bacterium]|nr:HAMP domain-containing sensor histidine kinase [Streptosporangiaceae bacterium]